jgi:hypothetical protein
MAHRLVRVAPDRQASVDVVFIGMDYSAAGNIGDIGRLEE